MTVTRKVRRSESGRIFADRPVSKPNGAAAAASASITEETEEDDAVVEGRDAHDGQEPRILARSVLVILMVGLKLAPLCSLPLVARFLCQFTALSLVSPHNPHLHSS